ncbi:hypothetical protein B0H13DRAFT_2666374 [Mycena leptocephala]|nr:hypothetical protein B0H13DRAFT_2666374 [Mycena leptocephala]
MNHRGPAHRTITEPTPTYVVSPTTPSGSKVTLVADLLVYTSRGAIRPRPQSTQTANLTATSPLESSDFRRVATPSYARHPPPSHARPAYVRVHTHTTLLLPYPMRPPSASYDPVNRPPAAPAPFPASSPQCTSAIVNRERTQPNRAYFLASPPRGTSAESMASADTVHARIRALLNASSGFAPCPRYPPHHLNRQSPALVLAGPPTPPRGFGSLVIHGTHPP